MDRPGFPDVVKIRIPLGIDKDTMELVRSFAESLADKLRQSEVKYKYGNGWKNKDWMDECREKLREHLEKGDPRDVAAYAAFLWYHDEPTVKK